MPDGDSFRAMFSGGDAPREKAPAPPSRAEAASSVQGSEEAARAKRAAIAASSTRLTGPDGVLSEPVGKKKLGGG